MDTLNTILAVALAIFVLFILIKLLTAPIRLIFKLLLNALFGIVVLFLVNFVGQFFGISLEITAINALVAGIFGLPGVVVLILLQILG